jgi:DNA-binding transcriptional ArsR family regulator
MADSECFVRIIHKEKVDNALDNSLSQEEISSLSRIFKAFSDPGRLKILYALSFQEMCVCDLAALLDISESAVSHQLRTLRASGLVKNRREGTVLYYTLTTSNVLDLIDIAQKIDGDL